MLVGILPRTGGMWMRRLFIVACIALGFAQAGACVATAGEIECTRYVPAVGKIVRVPCDEGRAPAAGTQSPPASAMQFTPGELDKVAPLRSQLAQLAATMRSAEG